jgi:hypothetical protein
MVSKTTVIALLNAKIQALQNSPSGSESTKSALISSLQAIVSSLEG